MDTVDRTDYDVAHSWDEYGQIEPVSGPALDRSNPVPLYHQLLQVLEDQINSGEIASGEMLPTEKELEATYGVSRVTVRKALEELARSGRVVRQQGRGTFVTSKVADSRSELLRGFMEDMLEQGISVSTRPLFTGVVTAANDVAKRLQIPPGRQIYRITRVGLMDEEPVGLSDLWVAVDEDLGICCPELGIEPPVFSTLKALLAERYGIALAGGTKWLEATLCSEDEAKLLDTTRGAPLLLARVVITDQRGRPVIYIKARYRGERYVYCLSLRA